MIRVFTVRGNMTSQDAVKLISLVRPITFSLCRRFNLPMTEEEDLTQECLRLLLPRIEKKAVTICDKTLNYIRRSVALDGKKWCLKRARTLFTEISTDFTERTGEF